MTLLERGRIHDGRIVLPQALPLPEGTEVTVRIDTVGAAHAAASGGEFASLPFFGLWQDRKDMADSDAWVRKEREQWAKRANQRD